MPRGKSSRAELARMGQTLESAFPISEPGTQTTKPNGGYSPDRAADARYDQLLDRLKGLGWDDRGAKS